MLLVKTIIRQSPLIISTGASEVSSGDYGRYITDFGGKDEDGFDIDDSDYDIFIEEVSYPAYNFVNQIKQTIYFI